MFGHFSNSHQLLLVFEAVTCMCCCLLCVPLPAQTKLKMAHSRCGKRLAAQLSLHSFNVSWQVQVRQAACGMHHTLLLASPMSPRNTGIEHGLVILGCGTQKHGQLGVAPAGTFETASCTRAPCFRSKADLYSFGCFIAPRISNAADAVVPRLVTLGVMQLPGPANTRTHFPLSSRRNGPGVQMIRSEGGATSHR